MNKLLKKIVILMALALLVTACPKKDKSSEVDGDIKNIAIAKIIAHPALDAVEKGVIDELNESGIKVKFDLQNANGDMNTASSIANKFKSEQPDVVVGIATPIAVALANAMKNTPIVFTAVTDPVASDLVETMDKGYNNVTGLADTIPIADQLLTFHALFPFKRLGLIYTNSETNAISMAKTTEAACKEMGVEFVSSTISNPSEVKQAAESMIGRIDAFYVTTDNSLVAGVSSLYTTAKANNIPVFSGDITSSLEGGAVYVLGFNYYMAGRMTGKIVIEILGRKKPSEIPVVLMTDPKHYLKLIDLDAAKRLGITISQEDIDTANYIVENGTTTKKDLQ